MAQESSR